MEKRESLAKDMCLFNYIRKKLGLHSKMDLVHCLIDLGR